MVVHHKRIKARHEYCGRADSIGNLRTYRCPSKWGTAANFCDGRVPLAFVGKTPRQQKTTHCNNVMVTTGPEITTPRVLSVSAELTVVSCRIRLVSAQRPLLTRFDCSLAKQTTSFADMSQTFQCGDLFSAYQISESCWYDGVCMFCQNCDVHAVYDQSRDRDPALWGNRCRIETTRFANLAHRWQTVFAGQSPPF